MRVFPGFLAVAALAMLGGCETQVSPPSGQQGATVGTDADSADGTNEAVAPGEPMMGDVVEHPAGDARAPLESTQASPDTAPPSSEVPTRPAALRPRADRGTTSEGVEKITFDDLILGMQADMVFRPWMLESETNGGRAKELEGKRVRLPGIMHGGVKSTEKNKDFVLLRNKECKFGPGGQADHLAKVFMKDGKTVAYSGDETLFVEGTLRIKPSMGDDGNTWSIYELEDAEVK
jgi:hypothetical protein